MTNQPSSQATGQNPVTDDNELSDLIRLRSQAVPEDRAYQITSFVLSQIWGGNGYANGVYRAKLTLWKGPVVVAELNFHDPATYDPSGIHQNRPADPIFVDVYELHFPISTLDAIMRQLYFRNDDPGCPVKRLISYSYGSWCIESVGGTRVIVA